MNVIKMMQGHAPKVWDGTIKRRLVVIGQDSRCESYPMAIGHNHGAIMPDLKSLERTYTMSNAATKQNEATQNVTVKDAATRRAALIAEATNGTVSASAIAALLQETASLCVEQKSIEPIFEDIGVLVGIASGQSVASKTVAVTIVQPLAKNLKRAFGIVVNANKGTGARWKEDRYTQVKKYEDSTHSCTDRVAKPLFYKRDEQVMIVPDAAILKNAEIVALGGNLFTMTGKDFGENPYSPDDKEKALKAYHKAKFPKNGVVEIKKVNEASELIWEAFQGDKVTGGEMTLDDMPSAKIDMT